MALVSHFTLGWAGSTAVGGNSHKEKKMKKTVLLALFLVSLSVFVFANIQNIPWVSFPKDAPGVVEAVPAPATSVLQPKDTSGLLVPWDASFILALTPNDDGYTDVIPFGFNFSMYGTIYNSCWINNNGNVTFDAGYSSFTAWGFPINGAPMLAPFFADVDTRGAGNLWYKIEANRMIVIWDAVGYYNTAADKLNTFELIFTDGTDPTIGIGNTVAFSYGDMAWTTGSASGGAGGFGGTPANVGINKGDGVTFAQIGRFDHPGTDYDGAFDNNDGIDWLDNIDLFFNTGSGGGGVLIITPSTVDGVTNAGGYPAGTGPGDPGMEGYVATYPGPGTQTIVLPVGPGIWRGWAWYNSVWNPADVFPFTGPGDLTWSNVPFGAKSDVPILIVNDNTLPVELSSFTAYVTASNFVNLTWTTQSETGMIGYQIYRNESSDLATAVNQGFQAATNSSVQHVYNHADYEVSVGSTYYYWLEAMDLDGSSRMFGPVVVTISETGTPNLPTVTTMGNAYPNPFSNIASIDVAVKEGENATISVYNIYGQMVRSYQVAAGTHTLKWDGVDMHNRACSNGIYFFRLSSPSINQTRKMILVK